MVTTTAHDPHMYGEDLSLLDAISGKWTIMTVLTLDGKTLRHNELRRELGHISQKMLTQTLRNLERNGIVNRTVFPVVPPHVEYSLTPTGISLIRALKDIRDWAETNQAAAKDARQRFDTTNNAHMK